MLIVSLAMMELVSLQVKETSLGVERQRHFLPPSSWPAPSPLTPANAHCRHSQEDVSKDATTLLALGSLPGSSHCNDTDSKVIVGGSSEARMPQTVPSWLSQKGYTATSSHLAQCMLNEEQAEMLCAPFPLFHLLIFIPSMHASILYMKVIVKAASYI